MCMMDHSKGMPDYRSQFTGDEIDWALSRMFDFDIASNGCIKLKSDEKDPYNLDVLFQPGNYVVYFFEGGSKPMEGLKPLCISVTYINDILTQYAMILDCVQYRSYIDNEWTEWETWYTTGYIYQQSEPPNNPQKNTLWIDISDPESPVLYCWNGVYWKEVRPSDTMDITIYDPEKHMTDIYAYIERRIEEFDGGVDGTSFHELYQIHVADNVIHFNRKEKKELMAKPSEKELQAEIEKITAEYQLKIQNKLDSTIGIVQDLIDAVETDSGSTMRDHFNDSIIHVTPQDTQKWNMKADCDHDHNLDGKVKIKAEDIIQGVFKEEQIPPIALETCEFVENDEERFKLTTDRIQNGDTVCVKNGNTGTGRIFYFVIDDTKLNKEEGYTPYSALLAGEIPFNRIIDRPTTKKGYGIIDVPTFTELQDAWEKDDSITTTYISTVFSRSTILPKITGYFHITNMPIMVYTAHMVNNYLYYADNQKDENGNYYIWIRKLKFGQYDFGLKEPYTELYGTNIAKLLGVESENRNYFYTGGSISPFYEENERNIILYNSLPDPDTIKTLLLQYGSNNKYIMNTTDGILYEIKNEKAIKTSHPVNVYLCNNKGNLVYSCQEETKLMLCDAPVDIVCECNILCVNSVEYTLIHNRYILALHKLGLVHIPFTGMQFYEYKLSLGVDSIILQTEIYKKTLYVLYFTAIDTESEINADWKAYKLTLNIAKISIDKNYIMNMISYPVMEMNEVIEVGSDFEIDYITNLENRYLHHFNNPNTEKEYYMSFSNGCIVIFNKSNPLITLQFMNWGVMNNKFIDRDANSVDDGIVVSSHIKRTSYQESTVQTILSGVTDNKRYISYDGYNYIRLNDKSVYMGDDYEYLESKMIAVNKDISFEIINTRNIETDSIITYGVIIEKEDIAGMVKETIDTVDAAIKTETGSITSNISVSNMSEYVGAPTILSGIDNNGFSFSFADYSIPNPSFYGYFESTLSIIKKTIPAKIIGAPVGYVDMYIKGGYERSSSFILLLFTMPTGNPILGLAIMTSETINIIDTQEISMYSSLIIDDREKFIIGSSFKTYLIGKYIYAFMEYSKKETVTGFSRLTNYMIVKIDYDIGIMNILYPKFNDAFYNDSRLSSIIRAYYIEKRLYIIRANATYFSILVSQMDDPELSQSYRYTKLEFDIYNSILERCIPEPFMLNNKLTFGYTNKAGNLILKQFSTEGSITDIDTGITILDPNKDGKEQYNAIYEESSHSLSLINVYRFTDDETIGEYRTLEILNYYIYDTNDLTPTGILYSGKISNAILTGYTDRGDSFRFPDFIKLTVGYTTTLLPASFFEEIDERNSVFGKNWPILRIARDTGPETLAKYYQLTSNYVRKIADYEERFLSIRNQISSCADYADKILEIIG